MAGTVDLVAAQIAADLLKRARADGVSARRHGLSAHDMARHALEVIANAEMPLDVGVAAQRAAQRHLAACWEALEISDAGGEAQSPACAPFCGCETCEIREILHAAWPVFVKFGDGR